MKKILSILLFIVSVNFSFSQTDFKWEKIDSVPKTKDQIYSDTKMFIAENWKSAQNVIQNDDKEGGVILVKGLNEQSVSFTYVFVFEYSVKILFKENKYKLVIENVHCAKSYNNKGGSCYNCLEPFEGENYTDKGSFSSSVLPKKYAINIMALLKKDLQGIVDEYETKLSLPSPAKEDW